MNDLEFYKSIYDRELNRRTTLDDSINVVVGIISLLIGLISYFYSNSKYLEIINSKSIINILLIASVSNIAASIIYLIKSYNNFLKGFNYPNISYLEKVRNFQIVEIPKYNNTAMEDKKIDFEKQLVDRIIRITDENTKINDKRAFDMYIAKTFIIIALTILFITTLILINIK